MPITKICKKCCLEKQLVDFYRNNKMKDGYLNHCKECNDIKTKECRLKNQVKNKETRKKYLEKHKEQIAISSKLYHDNYYDLNKEKIIQYQKEYYVNNIGSKREYDKEYRLLNKDKRNSYHKKRSQSDELYRLTVSIRSIIATSLRRSGYGKKSKTNLILGCSFVEFKHYLESKFESWMTWVNYGRYNGELDFGWDIDHIIPISSATTEEEVLKLNHYKNLQPMCSKMNRDIKKNKYETNC